MSRIFFYRYPLAIVRHIRRPSKVSRRTVEQMSIVLSLLYSCGLRAGEVINLKIGDTDSKPMLISVCKWKAYKESTVMLSEKILLKLKEYYQAYKPKYYLFEGHYGDKYSVTSLRHVLNAACRNAGVNQKVPLHWLRHSFATHLLEAGTDI